MKTNIYTSMRYSIKLFAVITGMIIFSINSGYSQESSQKSFAVYPSFGIGIGFFSPSDVNDYIDADLSQYSEVINEDMYAYLDLRAGVTFRLKAVDFTAALEYSIAPKFVVGGTENITYSFTRLAPEVSFNYYIPNKTGKHAFFLGGAINYSFLKFEDYEASAPGFKLQLGYSLQFGKFNLQPYGAYRYAKATDSIGGINSYDFELNYSGFQIGVILSFHDKILYK